MVRFSLVLHTPPDFIFSHYVDSSEEDKEEEECDTEDEEFADLYRLYSRKFGYADLSSVEYEDEDTEFSGYVENEGLSSNCDSEGGNDISGNSEDESDTEDEDGTSLSDTADTDKEDGSQSESGCEEGIDAPHFNDCVIQDTPPPDLSEVENE